MKIGILSDAHGNPSGLKGCIEYLQTQEKVDRIFFLGDAVGYLPAYNEVIELLKKANAACVLGNHDAMLLEMLPIKPSSDMVYQITKNRRDLLPDNYNYISTWPLKLEITIKNRRLLFIHGSPWEPLTGYIYPDTDLSRFEELNFDVVFMGQTHHPFIRSTESRLVVNTGSCGLPRDHGSMASCAVYKRDTHKERLKH